MADAEAPHVEQPGPAEFHDPLVRTELRRASVWFGMALLIAGVILLAQPLLLIAGGLVFAVILDGGTRLLGRMALPDGTTWRGWWRWSTCGHAPVLLVRSGRVVKQPKAVPYPPLGLGRQFPPDDPLRQMARDRQAVARPHSAARTGLTAASHS